MKKQTTALSRFRICRSHPRRMFVVIYLALAMISTLPAAIYTLKNNVQVEGSPGKIGGIGETPLASNNTGGEVGTKLVHFADDGIRRTFFSEYQVLNFVNSPPENLERISLNQRVATIGKRLAAVGPILNITPLDEFGRRLVSMQSSRGALHIVQGLTEVNPRYATLESVVTNNSIIWKTRIATSSIPTTVLSRVLKNHLDMKNPDDRLKIVRLYMQCERYQDAMFELQSAIEQFPELANLKQQIVQLRQALAERLITEIESRQTAGQHARVYKWLSNFPSEGVAVETLLRARDLLKDYDDQAAMRNKILLTFDRLLEELEDEPTRQSIEPIREEIRGQLNINTIARLADFNRLADDTDLGPDSKLALAISGWLMGQGDVTENLAVAISLFDVRNEVRNYLQSNNALQRLEILERLKALEGSTPANVAKLLAAMKPTLVTEKKGPPEESAEEVKAKNEEQNQPLDPLHHVFEITGPGGAPFLFHVQLPPDYDPYRKYPCIVSLHGAGGTPAKQIDWWAGTYNKQTDLRLGQASRHGYIVIAPAWTKPYQNKYEYSAQEHGKVLYALKNSFKRFSIDTDRVFLSGHSIGGDAVWDIALAHPDLWAGVLPIAATAGKYVGRYWQNAKHISFYFVGGEMDGNRVAQNMQDFNRYLTKFGFDTMIVEYKGRGHDHFQDDIHFMFDWMRAHRRNFSPQTIKCTTMRPWDNFFWWVELEGMPSTFITLPLQWPRKAARDALLEAEIGINNRIRVKSPAKSITVYLNPDIVDFQENVSLNLSGKTQNEPIVPNLEDMLEDVRTRGDRLNPFWAKVTLSR
ncbi:MAG: peptidase [Planctomycetaceae bacterium]|jgi:predicted esterase|nr:peptidase [Planctomycetaceae bacterium]